MSLAAWASSATWPFAPDGRTGAGGYPGDEEKAAALFGPIDKPKMREDFIAGAQRLEDQSDCTGKIGAVGFCFDRPWAGPTAA